MVDAKVRSILDKASGLDARVEEIYTGWETEGSFALSNGYRLEIKFDKHYGVASISLKDESGTYLLLESYTDAETIEYAWNWYTPKAKASHDEWMRRQVKKEKETQQRIQDFVDS